MCCLFFDNDQLPQSNDSNNSVFAGTSVQAEFYLKQMQKKHLISQNIWFNQESQKSQVTPRYNSIKTKQSLPRKAIGVAQKT